MSKCFWSLITLQYQYSKFMAKLGVTNNIMSNDNGWGIGFKSRLGAGLSGIIKRLSMSVF